MKHLFSIFGSVMIMLLLISSAEAAPQSACGYVVGLALRTNFTNGGQTFTTTTAIALSGGMPGLFTGMATTLDRDFAKIALLYKMNGLQMCIMYDADASADNNIMQFTL